MSKNPFKNHEEKHEEIKENAVEETTAKQPEQEVKTEDEKKEVKETEKLQAEYDKLNQQYIRLAADFDNFRKRQEQERESLLRFGTENALTKMLEILDNFERGAKALENIDDAQKVKESFNLIYKQVQETLQKLGLEEIDAEGKEFDPNFHNAVMRTPTKDQEEHTIINVLQKGYKAGDKVLRPALVNVATPE